MKINELLNISIFIVTGYLFDGFDEFENLREHATLYRVSDMNLAPRPTFEEFKKTLRFDPKKDRTMRLKVLQLLNLL